MWNFTDKSILILAIDKQTLLPAVVAVFIVQQAFALFSLWQLMKKEPELRTAVLWHFIAVLLPLIGPTVVLLFARRLPMPEKSAAGADSAEPENTAFENAEPGNGGADNARQAAARPSGDGGTQSGGAQNDADSPKSGAVLRAADGEEIVGNGKADTAQEGLETGQDPSFPVKPV
jgi:hypothetical protein